MKKLIIAVAAIATLVAGAVYAKDIVTLKVSSYSLSMDAFPDNSIKKFVDGNNICYVYAGGAAGGGISCLKVK